MLPRAVSGPIGKQDPRSWADQYGFRGKLSGATVRLPIRAHNWMLFAVVVRIYERSRGILVPVTGLAVPALATLTAVVGVLDKRIVDEAVRSIEKSEKSKLPVQKPGRNAQMPKGSR